MESANHPLPIIRPPLDRVWKLALIEKHLVVAHRDVRLTNVRLSLQTRY